MTVLDSLFKTKKGSVAGDVVSYILAILLSLTVIWGIVWSFYRHSVFDGVVSLLFPPYAVYRGVAFFWEEPAWKEKYDLRTEELAMLIAYSSTNDPVYQLESRRYVDRVKQWLQDVPLEEKQKLLKTSNSFIEALDCFLEILISNLLNNTQKDPLTDPRIKTNEKDFMKIDGFAKIWNSTINDANLFEKFSAENDLRDKVASSDEKAFLVSRANTLLSSSRNKMKETINSIFE